MGKKQHQKDKLYLTTNEWKHLYGGHKDDTSAKLARAKFRRLPFTHCSLSLQPFEHPLCTTDGTIFDLMQIVPYLQKNGVNPVTGEKLDAKSLVKLNFHKNPDGDYHCPITYKIFTSNSHIVAVRPSGNVYSYEAIDELNFKSKNLRDLLSDEPFVRKDIITIQDPSDLDKFNIAKFHHVHLEEKTNERREATRKAMEDPNFYLKKVNSETRDTLLQLRSEYVAKEETSTTEVKADAINAAHYSRGRVAAGFTSTVMPTLTSHEAAVVDEDELRYRRVGKKAYVRLVTSKGALNVELHADLTPRACENFVKHCKSGYYNDTRFHRVIRNFMMQGGDPKGDGTGGASVWGAPFKDEFAPQLNHGARGVLSMANKGSDTNCSQFFITFRQSKQLDRKHTVFGRVVGGLDTLSAIERVDTDNQDIPLEDVRILNAQVFVDPFEEADEKLAAERAALASKPASTLKSTPAAVEAAAKAAAPKPYRKGVGKYIAPSTLGKAKRAAAAAAAVSAASSDEPPTTAPKKSKLVRSQLSDFSAW